MTSLGLCNSFITAEILCCQMRWEHESCLSKDSDGGLQELRGCIQKFPDWVDNEIYAYNNKHSLRSNAKGYGGKTHETDSQNSDTTTHSGRELYHLQFSLQAASPGTFGYNLVTKEADGS
jgi:hypothetical protein